MKGALKMRFHSHNVEAMPMQPVRRIAIALAGLAVVSIPLFLAKAARAELTVEQLAARTHFHGIAVDTGNASRLFLATHHGLFAVTPDGKASRISATSDDFMGFTAHPTDPLVLYASGHPEIGGNLGLIVSRDGGRNWTRLSAGLGGPVDFHQMDVSKADPNVIYGVYGDIQRSDDGGRTWRGIGPPPDDLIRLAASRQAVETLYAATQKGLLKSTDAGRTWQIAHLVSRPATMVYVTHAGDAYAFMVGTGLLRAKSETADWEVVSPGLGRDVILHLAADPKDNRRLYAVAYDTQERTQRLVASGDGGVSWSLFGAQR
jgi:photosystem II stability/assembly factor-like uncharacterized protein